jgi:hypothetical protein
MFSFPWGFPLLPLGGVEYHLHAQHNIPDGELLARLALLGCLFPDRSVGWDELHSTSEFMHSVLNVSGSVLWHNSDRS